MRRRKILQAIGAASIGVSATTTVNAEIVAGGASEVNAETFDGADKQNLISEAFSDPDLQEIASHVESRGWAFSEKQIEARRVNYKENGGHYDFIVAEAKRKSKEKQNVDDEELIVIWIGNDTVGLDLPQHAVAHHIRKTADVNGSNGMQTGGLFGWDEITVMKSEDGTVSEQEHDFHADGNLSSTDNNLDPGGGGGGSDCCEVDVEIGANPSWSCMAFKIISAGLSGWSCSLCIIDPTRATCAICVIAAASTGISFYACVSSSVTIQDEVKKSWLEDEDLSCSDFWPSNDNTLFVSEGFYHDELPTC